MVTRARYATIEGSKEVKLIDVIVDVKRPSVRFFEWATWPRRFAVLIAIAAFAALVFPVLLPIAVLFVFILAMTYEGTKHYLPARYPAWSGVRDPGLLSPADKPSMAEGIMFMGVVDASDPYWRNMQVFLSADDLKRHMLVLGTTGSGKSEALKGITLNILCWASGFFLSDAKADNKLPTDIYSQVRMLGRDYDFLVLSYLLGGLSPQEISNLRERLSNGVQPCTSADADTMVQMTSNIMVKAGGDSKSWQERGLNVYRGICRALFYKRDRGDLAISFETLRDYLALEKIEDLYMEGYLESLENGGEWPGPYMGIKSYLEVGLPGFKLDILFRKKNVPMPSEAANPMAQQMMAGALSMGGMGAPGGKAPATAQSNDTFNQHGYRADQMYPALSLMIDTYGHIFKRKYPEIDMEDVVTNNRICVSLIPSLEKGSQEQESLGKLNLALLRVMMAKALGASVEGDVKAINDAKITNYHVPFGLLLDEFAYQFADGIALMTAQVRSLNFFLLALAQDLEKLTEGDKAAEAGAMMANQGFKLFMKIKSSNKTHELAKETLGEAAIAVATDFERETGGLGLIKKRQSFRIENRARVSRQILESLDTGFSIFSYREQVHVMRCLYTGDKKTGVPRVRYPRLNRFLQCPPDRFEQLMHTHSVLIEPSVDKEQIEQLVSILNRGEEPPMPGHVQSDVIQSLQEVAMSLNPEIPPIERGITLYQVGVDAIKRLRAGESIVTSGLPSQQGRTRGASGGSGMRPAAPFDPNLQAHPNDPFTMDLLAESRAAEVASLVAISEPEVEAPAPAPTTSNDLLMDLSSFDPMAEAQAIESPLQRKPKSAVFPAAPAKPGIDAPVAMLAAADEDDGEVLDQAEVQTQAIGPEDIVQAGQDDTHDVLDVHEASEAVDPLDELLPEALRGGSKPPEFVAPIAQKPLNTSPEVVLQKIENLASVQVSDVAIGKMGEDVVGLREATLTGIATVEMALGHSKNDAEATAESVERAVAQTLSYNGSGADASDIESFFDQCRLFLDDEPPTKDSGKST